MKGGQERPEAFSIQQFRQYPEHLICDTFDATGRHVRKTWSVPNGSGLQSLKA